jgi:hypothetical protein
MIMTIATGIFGRPKYIAYDNWRRGKGAPLRGAVGKHKRQQGS